MEKKFRLTEETINHNGRTLYRIQALRSFRGVDAGDLGGFVEKEANLSQYDDDSWIFRNAKVYDKAHIYNDSRVYDNAEVFGRATIFHGAICDNAKVYGHSEICSGTVLDNAEVYGYAQIDGRSEINDNSKVFGHARVYHSYLQDDAVVYDYACVQGANICGNAVVKHNRDYIVFMEWWNNGVKSVTWTRSNNMWMIGGLNLTRKQFIARKSRTKGWTNYKRIIDYVDSILNDQQNN